MSLLCHLHAEHSAQQSEHPGLFIKRPRPARSGGEGGAPGGSRPGPRSTQGCCCCCCWGGGGQPGAGAGVRSQQMERTARMKQDREPRALGWQLAHRCHQRSRSADLFPSSSARCPPRHSWRDPSVPPGRVGSSEHRGGVLRGRGAGPRGERLTLSGCGETPAGEPDGDSRVSGDGPFGGNRRHSVSSDPDLETAQVCRGPGSWSLIGFLHNLMSQPL